MKLPEPLFIVINPTMRFLLRSPLHSLLSGSLMLITFTGRKSGRRFTTPVRYVRDGETVMCFTTADTQWWRNLRGGADVILRTEGRDAPYRAEATDDDPEKIREGLLYYLDLFPQDADYHEIRLNKDKSPVPEDLDAASRHSIMVEARPVH